MTKERVRFIYENCESSKANDRSLPNNAFLVTYEEGGETKYDVVQSTKVVDIFDRYYDKYKKGLISITQGGGTANPKLWNGGKKDE